MPIVIRPARASDIDDIVSLVQQYWEFENIPGFDRARVSALLAEFLDGEKKGACWLADADGCLAGYLLAVFMFSLEHGGMMAEIDELFVAPGRRSLGIGAALLREADRAMSRDGLVRVQLQLGVRNSGGRIFYERHGFRPRSDYTLWERPLRDA
jgi:GNAT superfamily N-acetyltransferase